MASNPFAPSTKFHGTTSPATSTRPVTLPALPELFDDAFLDKLLPAKPPAVPANAPKASAPTNTFMDALEVQASLVHTTNGALAHNSTGSACLDAFNTLNAETDHADYERILATAWAEDPLATVRLIFHLRSIHEGLAEREPFYRAFAWLYHNHPRTAIANLGALVAPLIDQKIKTANKSPEDGWTFSEEQDEDVDARPDVRHLTHGYYKDLLSILLLATEDELWPGAEFNALHNDKENGRSKSRSERRGSPSYEPYSRPPLSRRERLEKRAAAAAQRDARIEAAAAANLAAAARAREERRAMQSQRANQVEDLLKNDKAYRALFIAVARLFASALSSDVQALRQIADEKTSAKDRIWLSYGLTLAAKWAPSVGACHDKRTNIATAISQLLFVSGSFPTSSPALSNPVTQDEAHRIRGMYTRWVISPLRRFLQIPEVLMSARRWNAIRYDRVPSTCMSNNTDLFHKRDEERFSKYLLDVARGARKISGATLMPHELLLDALGPMQEHQRAVNGAQWKTMVSALRDSGALENCLAVCDVSGSMGNLGMPTTRNSSSFNPKSVKEAKKMRNRAGQTTHIPPIAPAIALSLVLAQVAKAPWNDRFITFSERPQLVHVAPDMDLSAQARFMHRQSWGMNTNYSSVFLDLLLPAAVKNGLKRDEMIKRLFVFSDMQFDNSRQGGTDGWATEHELIKTKFEKAGYDMPEIVYWNLAGGGVGARHPVQKDEAGTALVTGFSPNMLKLFMEGAEITPDDWEKLTIAEDEDENGQKVDKMEVETVSAKADRIDPLSVMRKALERPSYATLKVHD